MLGCAAVRVGGTTPVLARLPRRGGDGRRRPGGGVAANGLLAVACAAAMGCGGCNGRWFVRRGPNWQCWRRVLAVLLAEGCLSYS